MNQISTIPFNYFKNQLVYIDLHNKPYYNNTTQRIMNTNTVKTKVELQTQELEDVTLKTVNIVERMIEYLREQKWKMS